MYNYIYAFIFTHINHLMDYGIEHVISPLIRWIKAVYEQT